MDGETTDAADTAEIRVWDLPTRLFHWALVVFFCTSWGLGEWGPAIMTLHFQSGYALAALLAFRLLWGFAGPRPARFGAFLRPPREVLAYARHVWRREPSRWPGHNPMGGWWIAATLLVIAAQIGTGLIADPEDFINVGPFADMVSTDASRWATAMHHRLGNVLLGLVALHLAAVAFYRVWKREDLVRPMITGVKRVRRD